MLWMVISDACIRLKSKFSHRNFGKFNLVSVKVAMKFGNLPISKIINIRINSFQYIFEIFKHKYTLLLVFDEPKIFLSKCFSFFFTKLKVLLWNLRKINNNPLLSKSRSKSQWISIWVLVFNYCISNDLPQEKL